MKEGNNRKIWIKQGGICIALLILIWGPFFFANKRLIEKNDIKNMTEDVYSFVFQIDEIRKEGKKMVLDGWLFKTGTDISESDMEILIYDIAEDDIIYPEVKQTKRNDVNSYFLCENDYSESGFIAKISDKKIDTKKKYEILIADRDKKKVYQTGTYIFNKELCYADPEKYEAINVENLELKNIIDNGKLRVFRPDVGIYVYQYKGDLYWIADDTYMFEEDGSTYIQYQMHTTQIQKLPKERLENNTYWSNIGFVFENSEIDIGGGEYRVAKREIPTEYSVTDIWTGYNVNGWVWVQHFRPWYEFN